MADSEKIAELEAALDVARETNRRLHRRTQFAESIWKLNPSTYLLEEQRRREVAKLRNEIVATDRMMEEWKGRAIALGVNGRMDREPRKLALRFEVDEMVLVYGGVDVLTHSLVQIRDEYKTWLRKRQEEKDAAAIAFNTGLADVARAKRLRESDSAGPPNQREA